MTEFLGITAFGYTVTISAIRCAVRVIPASPIAHSADAMPHRALPFVVIHMTPPGRGAVATLRIEGPGALGAVAAVFRARGGRPLGEFPPQTIVVGRIGAGDGTPGEEVVVCRCGGDAVELHCHGGLAAVAAIEEALGAAGGRPLAWREWAENQSSDPIAAAAIVALAEACTPRTAAILLDQYHGALRRALAEIEQTLDAGKADRAQGQIQVLLSRSPLGQHLNRPWIVHAEPGTTRDAVTVGTAIDGWPVELCDTAGLRPTEDPVEQAGIDRARCRLASADLIVLVCDASATWLPEDQALLDRLAQGAASQPILVHNKCDLPIAAARRPAGLPTSALRGDGIERLWAAIAAGLVPDPPPPGVAVPFTPGQVEMVRRLAVA
jgi:tRNA modification GTPase